MIVIFNLCSPGKALPLAKLKIDLYLKIRYIHEKMLDAFVLTIYSFDLHVLSTPPAFVLSQDQTL